VLLVAGYHRSSGAFLVTTRTLAIIIMAAFLFGFLVLPNLLLALQ